MGRNVDLEEQMNPKNDPFVNINQNGNSCCPTLSLNERMAAFVFFNVLGYILQIGSFARFMTSIIKRDPTHFALVYSFGNVLAIVGTLFLVGLKEQIRLASQKTRRTISLIYFGSLFLSIIFALTINNAFGKILTAISVAVQMISYWWYTFSYIPFARSLLRGCFACCKTMIRF